MAPLLIRVDAGECIGIGHLVRCGALAHAWGDGVCIATAALSGQLETRIRSAGATPVRIHVDAGTAEDVRATAVEARAAGAEWIVIDGYHFGTVFQRALSSDGFRVLCIDDNGEAGEYVSDIVLNQNLHADETLYGRRCARTRLLLGPDYVLLRPEFIEARPRTRETASSAKRILVTLGGGDAGETLGTVIDALALIGRTDLEVVVIAGVLAERRAPLQRKAAVIRGRAEVVEHSNDMHALMAWADLAVSAGGSTSWELAYMGVPTLTVVMAPNQVAGVAALVAKGIVAPLGFREELSATAVANEIESVARDKARRAAMSAAGRALIDGRGASRVVRAMRDN